MRYLTILAAVGLVLALSATAGEAQAITIDMVTVGNPGNAADMRYNLEPQYHHTAGYGAVSYAYNIGKYEVTAGQYTAFLNAVGATDTYALYNTDMWNSTVSQGIARSGSSGSYTYSVTDPFTNRPISKVSWGDAARFTNWLANGQPTGAQNASTTEDGSYYLNGAVTDAALLLVTRKANATWVLPTEDEWYKAAYYNPATGTYFNYPTSNDTAPGQDPADSTGNNANWGGIDAYDTTKVGEFQNSTSAYGTFDQGGNLWEWDEDMFRDYSGGSGDNDPLTMGDPLYRGYRGGSYQDTTDMLSAWYRNENVPTLERYAIGFRIVPEPATICILGLGALSLIRRKK